MIKKNYLLSPGPTPIPDDVLREGARPIIHHRTPEFSTIFFETGQGLKYVFQTEEDVYIMASSGTGAMEAAVVNLLSPGDRVLSVNAGKFGARWGHIGRAYGIDVDEIVLEWGASFTRNELADKLQAHPDYKAVFTTLSETSTGAIYDIQGFAEQVRQTQAVLVVDGISGLGAMPCPMDEWHIDVMISASQKSFMTPPGLSFAAFSKKAWHFVEKSELPKYYFDALSARKSLLKKTSPWTPAISLIIQQRKALERIQNLSLEKLFKHHQILGRATRAGIKALRLELVAANPGNILTAVKMPAAIDGLEFVRIMQEKYGVYIAGSQEPHRGEFFRIAHLGYIGAFDILTALSAVEMALSELGYSLTSGSAVAAAENILKEHWK